MIQPTWVQALPEMIGILRGQLEGQKTLDLVDTDESWAREAKARDVGNLSILEEGKANCGPYRLTVCAKSTEEDGENWQEPLLKLEIRPSPWWVNEVRGSSLQGLLATQVDEIFRENQDGEGK